MSASEDAKQLEQIRDVLGSLIVWMAQSANSPISIQDAEMLLKKLREPQP